MAHLHGKGLHRHGRGDFQLCELQLFGLTTAMEAQGKILQGFHTIRLSFYSGSIQVVNQLFAWKLNLWESS